MLFRSVDPRGLVVINEIMYHPLVPGASYVELLNLSSNQSFDLSNWRLAELGLTFPNGTLLTNGQFLLAARNRAAFTSTYSNAPPVAAEFSIDLSTNGQTLSLIKPGVPPDLDQIISRVRYEPGAPWPPAASGLGSSLQLLDPSQDNRRVSNWSDGFGWRFFTFTGSISDSRFLLYLSRVGDIYLDDLSLDRKSVV